MKEVFMPEPVDVSVRPDGALDFGNGIVGPTKADRDYVEQKFSNEETAVINELNSNGIVVTRSDSFLGKFLTSVKEKTTDTLKAVNQRLGGKPVRIGVPAVLAFAALTEACSGERATGQTGTEVDLVTVTPTPVATETMTPTPTPEVTVQPTPTATPEIVKAFDCGILSPEACVTGEYARWNRPDGKPTVGMVFTLKAGEQIKIPENLQVAGSEIPQPHTFNGYSITAVKDGGRYLYIGDIAPNGLEKVGKNLPAGTIVGTIAGSGGTVFKESPYNLIVIFPTEEDLKKSFPEQTKNPPKIINNESNPSVPGTGATFFDVKPPTQ